MQGHPVMGQGEHINLSPSCFFFQPEPEHKELVCDMSNKQPRHSGMPGQAKQAAHPEVCMYA